MGVATDSAQDTSDLYSHVCQWRWVWPNAKPERAVKHSFSNFVPNNKLFVITVLPVMFSMWLWAVLYLGLCFISSWMWKYYRFWPITLNFRMWVYRHCASGNYFVVVSSVCVCVCVVGWRMMVMNLVTCEDHCVSCPVIGYILMTALLLSILWNAKGQISILMCFPLPTQMQTLLTWIRAAWRVHLPAGYI